MNQDSEKVHFLCQVVEKISENKYRITVNSKDILDDPTIDPIKKIVIYNKPLARNCIIYVTNAKLDTLSRELSIYDYLDVSKKQDNFVEIEPELLSLIDSMDTTPNDLMEFLFQEELEEDELEESKVSDTEE